jgi:hypothetical protein
MTVPAWALLGMLGVLVGRAVIADRWRHVVPALLVLPAAQFAEPLLEPAATVFVVTSEVRVQAPPERVWHHLVEFGEIEPPTELPFRYGVAYPVRATIEGRCVGAIRRCSFDTGDFVEPIEVWDEPRLLRFSVIEHPPAMRELTLFPGRQPPHVDDYLVSQGGQFLLEPLAGGRTRLEGTTWYTHRLWPERYWKPWSDAILHAIHRRVLDHIAERAEAPQDS